MAAQQGLCFHHKVRWLLYTGKRGRDYEPKAKHTMWKQWLMAVLGLVVLATPFLALSASALMWTLALSGLIIAGLAVWSALEVDSEVYSPRFS